MPLGCRPFSSHRWLVRRTERRGDFVAIVTLIIYVDFGYDISDYEAIQPEYGTMEDFDELIGKAKALGKRNKRISRVYLQHLRIFPGIKIILDYVPNHSSDQHEWFIKSEARDPEYDNYYIWNDGRPNPDGGRPLPPNNWVSVFYGSAWTWSDNRQQYYFHQFTKQQVWKLLFI